MAGERYTRDTEEQAAVVLGAFRAVEDLVACHDLRMAIEAENFALLLTLMIDQMEPLLPIERTGTGPPRASNDVERE